MDNSYITVDPYEEIYHVSFGPHTADVFHRFLTDITDFCQDSKCRVIPRIHPKLQLQSVYDDAAESTLRSSRAILAGNQTDSRPVSVTGQIRYHESSWMFYWLGKSCYLLEKTRL